jgi:hypothetical protein
MISTIVLDDGRVYKKSSRVAANGEAVYSLDGGSEVCYESQLARLLSSKKAEPALREAAVTQPQRWYDRPEYKKVLMEPLAPAAPSNEYDRGALIEKARTLQIGTLSSEVQEMISSHPAWRDWCACSPAVKRAFGGDFARFVDLRLSRPGTFQGIAMSAEKQASQEIRQAIAEDERRRTQVLIRSAVDDPRWEQAKKWAAGRPTMAGLLRPEAAAEKLAAERPTINFRPDGCRR